MTALPTPESDLVDAVAYYRVSTKDQAERGGEIEGFSLPAQREACTRKAQQLGARLVEEFVEPGESAKTAARPQLKRMLAYIAEHRPRYVIVHKIDRLARNRADDVEITLAIKKHGATLVSVNENIDETPSGMLLHGIMSSIAEFYSANLANEIVKGTEQKVKLGGTPTVAPIGYLNVRKLIEGVEVRTVEFDPERAEHVRWAFEAYATGNYSLRTLADALKVRGLTRRPTRTRDARPILPNKLHQILRNRYYIGYVAWRGVEYPGSHEPLVDLDTFEKVQFILQGHRQSSAKPQRHTPYLAGTLYCARCHSKLIYAVSTGRHGGRYAYWRCLGQQQHTTNCDLPNLPHDKVEAIVASQWHYEQLAPEHAREIREGLLDDLRDHERTSLAEAARLDGRIHTIKRERFKWAEKAMEEAVPRDIAREKQRELADQLAEAERQRSALTTNTLDYERVILTTTELIADCGRAYNEADAPTRRAYNQAWYERVLLDIKNREPFIADADRTEIVQAVQTAVVTGPETPRAPETGRRVRRTANGPVAVNHRVMSRVGGSNVACLVVLTGLCWNPSGARFAAVRPGSGPAVEGPAVIRSRPRRLSADDIDAIVAAHEGGATIAELVERYGVHRTTISTHVRQAASHTDKLINS